MEAASTPLLQRREETKEETSGCCRDSWICRELRWAAKESHAMIWIYTAGACVEMAEREQRELWVLKYNPFYWLLMMFAMGCVLVGRWVHCIFGQGGPVREDELEIEREARVFWIYATDGPFFVSILFTIFEASLGDAGSPLSILFDLAIDAAYIFGNVLFLDSIRKMNVARIRVGIIANAAFSVALTVLLITGIIRHYSQRWSFYDRATWIARGMAVIFFALAVFIYARLWNVHGDIKPSGGLLSSDAAAYLGMLTAAIVVWALLILVVVISPTFVWDAVAT